MKYHFTLSEFSYVQGDGAYNEFKGTIEGIKPQIPAGARLVHSPPLPFNKGHDRQQHLMFWADNFTTREYVGFVDTGSNKSICNLIS